MVKALIVEDEPNIRNGLIRHPLWNELGFDEVLGADDGTSGLALIQRDAGIRIVVTDIRMKKMSGLEFIQQLYEREEFTGKVIILSGYDDFQYARTAMTFGVVNYLLKPVDAAELKAVVGRAAEQLKQEEGRIGHLRLMEDAMPKLKEQLLSRLAEYPAGADSRQREELQAYGLAWLLDGPLAMMLIEPDNLRTIAYSGGDSEQRLALFAIGNVVEYTLLEFEPEAGRRVMFRSLRHDSWLVLIGKQESEWTWLGRLASLIRERIQRYVKISASIAFATGGAGTAVHALYGEALNRLTQVRLYGYDAEGAPMDDAGLEYEEVGMLSGAQAITDLLVHGEREEVELAAAQFPILVRTWDVRDVQDLHRRVFEWLLGIFEAARKAGWKQDYWRRDPLRLWESIQTYDTIDALQGLAARYLLEVSDSMRETPRNQVLLQAERYIQDHFAEQLTVQSVSERVYVTPEWLSTLFKKHYDLTVLDYITRLRMEHAKALLQDVGLRIYQISGMVGYKDTVYFSRLFKKHTGQTPKEYRNQRGIAADE